MKITFFKIPYTNNNGQTWFVSHTTPTLFQSFSGLFKPFLTSVFKALSRAGEQAAASIGEDETLARLQLDEVKAAISNSEQELAKLNRYVCNRCTVKCRLKAPPLIKTPMYCPPSPPPPPLFSPGPFLGPSTC